MYWTPRLSKNAWGTPAACGARRARLGARPNLTPDSDSPQKIALRTCIGRPDWRKLSRAPAACGARRTRLGARSKPTSDSDSPQKFTLRTCIGRAEWRKTPRARQPRAARAARVDARPNLTSDSDSAHPKTPRCKKSAPQPFKNRSSRKNPFPKLR